MSKYKVEDIHNLALVGHRAAGKTTLADSLLFKAGAVERKGSVDDKTSISDYDDEEKNRHQSIDTSVLHLETQGKKLNILDALAGGPDFIKAPPWKSLFGRRDRRRRRLGASAASRLTHAACSTRPASVAWPACS